MKRLVPEVPTIAWGLLFVVINTFVNIRGIELTAMLNRIALVGELLVLGIFLVMDIWWLATDPMSNGFTLKPFYNEETFSMPLVMGAVSLGCLSFMGFDAISTLSEEAKDAKKGPGRAMIGSLMLVGVLFMAQTYIAGCLCTDGSVFADDPDNGFYLVASIAGGKFLYGLCALATAIAWGFLGVFSFGGCSYGAVEVVECEARACRLPVPNKTCSMNHFHMPRTLVKTQVGPPLGLSRRRAEGRACISGPGTPNRNRRPAEGAQSVGSFRSADTGLPAGPHFA